ncbi:hypothetical protein D3C80_708750 [compost metagenome]
MRGVGSVAGDFLGGGAQFVDRGSHAVGSAGLLTGVAHGRVGSVEHQPGHLVDLMGRRGDFADGAVDTLDETVEGAGHRAEFVVGMHTEALGQVALAFGDITHGVAQLVQRLHQYADQQAQGEDDAGQRDQGSHHS